MATSVVGLFSFATLSYPQSCYMLYSGNWVPVPVLVFSNRLERFMKNFWNSWRISCTPTNLVLTLAPLSWHGWQDLKYASRLAPFLILRRAPSQCLWFSLVPNVIYHHPVPVRYYFGPLQLAWRAVSFLPVSLTWSSTTKEALTYCQAFFGTPTPSNDDRILFSSCGSSSNLAVSLSAYMHLGRYTAAKGWAFSSFQKLVDSQIFISICAFCNFDIPW